MKEKRYIMKTTEFHPSMKTLPWVTVYQTVEVAGYSLDGNALLVIEQNGELTEVPIKDVFEVK